MKLILDEFQVSCDNVKLLDDNEDLYNQMQHILKSILIEGEDINYATDFSNLIESVKKEQSFYLNKTGFSLNDLSENSLLESAANILQETGIDDYNSDSLFLKYMSMIEKSNMQTNYINEISEHINKLKIIIDLQNDLKFEVSNITYTPIGYTAQPIDIDKIENTSVDLNCKKIIDLVKKIDNIEKKDMFVCEETLKLKSDQKKMYHGLPPNMDQAILAIQLAEKTMKSMSKQLIEKLGKN